MSILSILNWPNKIHLPSVLQSDASSLIKTSTKKVPKQTDLKISVKLALRGAPFVGRVRGKCLEV